MQKTILIIEDDKFLRDLMEKKLAGSGYNVLLADDGESGLEIIKEKKPDLVLLDILLPLMSGWEVMEKSIGNEATREIPIIFLTNLGDKKDISRGIKLGARDYIIKANFTPVEIVRKVRECLGEDKELVL